jgi:dTDP-4-dehydrorhamnose reductase
MYLIVGANGFLGSYMIKTILNETQDKILAADQSIDGRISDNRVEWISCDITKDDDLGYLNKKLAYGEPVNIIYLAAYHHPDLVKKNPRLAWNINITSLSRFLNTIENVRCFFYSSTEMVYGAGTIESYFTEEAKLSPVNIYGMHKVVAESLVTGYGYNVVRFPFLIGPCLIEGKKHFYDVIVDTIQSGQSIDMFKDAYKTALSFDTAAQVVIKLITNYSDSTPKVLNVAGDEVLSKYDIGIRIARKYGSPEELIVPISMKDDNEIFTEKRADCTLLDNSLVKKVLNIQELKLVF